MDHLHHCRQAGAWPRLSRRISQDAPALAVVTIHMAAWPCHLAARLASTMHRHATIRSRAARKHAPRHNSVQGSKKACTTPQFSPRQQERMHHATIRSKAARNDAPRHNSVQGRKKGCTTPQFGPRQEERMHHATIRSKAGRKDAPRHNSVQGNKKGCTTPQFGPGQQESMHYATIHLRATRKNVPRHNSAKVIKKTCTTPQFGPGQLESMHHATKEKNSARGNKKACTTPQFGPGQQEPMYHATIWPRATRKHVPRHKFGPGHQKSITMPQFARTTHAVSAARNHALCHVATLLQSVSPLPFLPPPHPNTPRLFPTSPSTKPANRALYQIYCRMWM